ncbi:MAG TPA: hypothetical protein VNU26_14430 [Mycobacteriales bacterium]|nr:hypothetical protein [Mycobacteriales bacterium]
MQTQERDDSLDWGDLPGGLSFADEDDTPPAPPAHPGLRRALHWLLVVALLGGAAVVGVRWHAERDVRAVLASSTSTWVRALDAVASAGDTVALAAAAGRADEAADSLADDLERLQPGDGGRRGAVRAQVTAERDVLLALAPLADVERGALAVWGGAHADLQRAVEAEAAARAALRRSDPDAVVRLPDTGAATRRVATTVGAAVVEDVQRSAVDLLDALAAAERTADLRAAAQAAGERAAAVAAAERGLAGTADGAVLREFAGALEAVQRLQDLKPADTSGWPAARSELTRRLRAVGDSDGGLTAGSVRGRLPIVLAQVDALVLRAEQAHAAWVPVHAAAVAQQKADMTALDRYERSLRDLDASVAALRSSAAQLSDRAGEPVPEGAAALTAVEREAASLARALQAVRPPAALARAHADVAVPVGTAAAALGAAAAALAADPCADCPVGSTAAWRAVAEVEAALARWPAALTAWEQAVAEARTAVQARPLPPPPDA